LHLAFSPSRRLPFNDARASGYVRSPTGALARVQPGTRLSLLRGEHVLALYDAALIVRVSITFEPGF
jgi:hypothetical protein